MKTANDNNECLVHFFEHHYKYVDQEKMLPAWCDAVCKKPHILRFDKNIQKTIRDRCMYFMSLFNKNLRYCGYSIDLFQKRKTGEEPELFNTIRNYEC